MKYTDIISQAKHQTLLSRGDRFVKISERDDRSEIPGDVWRILLKNTYLQTWKGIILNKGFAEIATYPMLLHELQPKTIIELGALNGGSALWLSDNLEIFGIQAEIYSVDIDLSLLDEKAKSKPNIHFIQGDCNQIESVLPPSILASLPHPWLLIDDVHINTIGICEYFHQNGLQTGDYFILEDTNAEIWKFWNDEGWEEEQEMREAVEKLNNMKKWLQCHEDQYLVDTHYQDLFGYNGSKNCNSVLQRV
ncbi:CmcI family methyltransferase [Moorena sp. SIO4G3]|uniref:CmcI family methyltransferase n=1 Tax=Moorena sp. SIO4G3 TaxID=2607821 RepID=UPI00142A63C2|nr:CmcI family methyltransferase [Moorena sp. SIO4G3]NEO75111.1 cephalosporin hydroxylase [Moorena sp. SIO4G3]